MPNEHGDNEVTARAQAALGELLAGADLDAAARAVAGIGSTARELRDLAEVATQLHTLLGQEAEDREVAENEARSEVLRTVTPEAALSFVAEARALHRPEQGFNDHECVHCRDERGRRVAWPCPTARALGCDELDD